ncbi:hypothetical protein MKEN_00841900 [Mycena kentingensis (nom. inval.)]|nr:hypothetical protein MKEN_00841900 [Mycena kentingensis (nom. inval.)]
MVPHHAKVCSVCKRYFKYGTHNHEPKCRKKRDARIAMKIRRQQAAQKMGNYSRVRQRPRSPTPPHFPSPPPMDVDSTPTRSQTPAPAPPRGRLCIEIEHHPHSGLPMEVIWLDSVAPFPPTSNAGSRSASPPTAPSAPRPTRSLVRRSRLPWAPYPTRPDLEWAETVYLLEKSLIKAQLAGMHGSWNPNGIRKYVGSSRVPREAREPRRGGRGSPTPREYVYFLTNLAEAPTSLVSLIDASSPSSGLGDLARNPRGQSFSSSSLRLGHRARSPPGQLQSR